MLERIALVGGTFLLLVAKTAIAVPVAPGDFVDTNSTTLEARPELAGDIIEDVTHPFFVDLGNGVVISGSVQEWVLRETATGTLDFYHRIFNDESSQGSIDYVTRSSFAGFTTDVDWRLDLDGAIHPNQALRSAGLGDEILFDQLDVNLLYPGVSSPYVFVKTDATQYGQGGVLTLAINVLPLGSGAILLSIPVFQPVPEPATLGMLATSCLILATHYWWRRRGSAASERARRKGRLARSILFLMAFAIVLRPCIVTAATDVVFDTFGPSDSYDLTFRYGPNQAFLFEPSKSGPLTSITVALGRTSTSTTQTRFDLYEAAGLNLGTLLETFVITNATPALPSPGAVVTFDSVLNPTLVTGNTYWLGFSNAGGPIDSDSLWFMNNQGISGFRMAAATGIAILPAFRVQIVPEPSAGLLLLMGLAAVVMSQRTRFARGLRRRGRSGDSDQCSLGIEPLESRQLLHGGGPGTSRVEELELFRSTPYYTMQDQITSGIVGDAAGGDRTYKVRIGQAAHRSEMLVVGDTTATQQTSTEVIVRRMVGDSPANMQATVQLVDGNPDWWSAELAQTTFQLGRAPTTLRGDVDDPGEIGRTVGDGDIDQNDLRAFWTYYTGPGVQLPANRALIGVNFDFDGDLDVDLNDWNVLVSQYTGPVTVPWNQKLDLALTAALDAPEGAMGRFQIVVTNIDTGETATTFAYGIKRTSEPHIELRARLDGTIEADTKLAFGRIVNFDLRLWSLGADADTIEIVADPIPGFSLNVLNVFALPTNQFAFDPQAPPQSVILQVVTPLLWAPGSEQIITLRARSTDTGAESVLQLKVVKAGALYTEDNLQHGSGRPHDVAPGGVTTFGFTVTNTTLATRTYSLSAVPIGMAPGWSTQFTTSEFTLAPLEERFVTMTVRAPQTALLGANHQWLVRLFEGNVLRGTNLVGTQVTNVSPKVIFVAIDGFDQRYFEMNAAGTGLGGPGDWLTPNLRALMERGTTYTKANSAAIHVTDPNHTAILTGSLPGTSGAYSVNYFYGGQDPDGAPLPLVPQDLGRDLLRYGPNGDPVLTIFDVAKEMNPNVSTAFVSNKGWLQHYYSEKHGGSVDVIVEGREMPLYVKRPTTHFLGDPPSDADPDDPRYDVSIGNWGSLPGLNPSDRWVMDNALMVLDAKDPGVMYILLGAVDESAHAFGTAAYLEEWDDRGTAATYDDVNRTNPRANREDSLDIVREADFLFGQLVAQLASRGILESTYIVLTADHSLVNHHPQFLDVAGILESSGYAHVTDYQLLTRAGAGLMFGTAPNETAAIEHILETAPSIAPGLDHNPWIILNRAEMQTGVDTATGRVVAAPGELYSQFYVEYSNDDLQWPDLIIMMEGNWALKYRQFVGGEDALLRSEYVGGHGGPATEPIPLILAGPNIPSGQVVTAPVEIIDIAPTLYALLGWSAPANVDGRILPGIPTLQQKPGELPDAAAIGDSFTLGALGERKLASLQLAGSFISQPQRDDPIGQADQQVRSGDFDMLARSVATRMHTTTATESYWSNYGRQISTHGLGWATGGRLLPSIKLAADIGFAKSAKPLDPDVHENDRGQIGTFAISPHDRWAPSVRR